MAAQGAISISRLQMMRRIHSRIEHNSEQITCMHRRAVPFTPPPLTLTLTESGKY